MYRSVSRGLQDVKVATRSHAQRTGIVEVIARSARSARPTLKVVIDGVDELAYLTIPESG